MSLETKALNRISAALGGEAKVQKNDILNQIADNVGNDDGGSGILVVNVLVDDKLSSVGSYTATCDKTYQEIYDGVSNGMAAFAIIKYLGPYDGAPNNILQLPLEDCVPVANTISFASVLEGNINNMRLVITPSGCTMVVEAKQ